MSDFTLTDLQKTENALILSCLLILRKGQITRECNRLPLLLAKYRLEKQNDSGLVSAAAQAAMKCITLARQYSEDLWEQADAYSQLLLMLPYEASEAENNAKIATVDKTLVIFLKKFLLLVYLLLFILQQEPPTTQCLMHRNPQKSSPGSSPSLT